MSRDLDILLVEDSPGDARLVVEYLRDGAGESFVVHHVKTLSEARAEVARHRYPVALLDLGLPDARGLEIVRALQEIAPEMALVVFTGLDDESLGLEAVRAGAQDYITKKQADHRLLPRTIHYAIERKRLESQLRGAMAQLEHLTGELEERVEARTADLARTVDALQEEAKARTLAQEALRDRERRFRAIFNGAFEMISLLSRDGTVVEANDTLMAYANLPPERVIGWPLWEVSPQPMAADVAQRVKALTQRAAAGDLARSELELPATEGETLHVDFSIKPVRDDSGQVVMLIAEGRDVSERRRLEREVLEIASAEQHRIGQDLHDMLGQQLTGVGFLAKVLEQNLIAAGSKEAALAARVAGLVTESVGQSRALARGLCPVELEDLALMTALKEFATNTSRLFGVNCVFKCPREIVVRNNSVAMHLYHIVREACTNAVKHGRAKNIVIRMVTRGDMVRLTVEDDGIGMNSTSGASNGLGVRIMNHRAVTIGASFEVASGSEGGTTVSCILPCQKLER